MVEGLLFQSSYSGQVTYRDIRLATLVTEEALAGTGFVDGWWNVFFRDHAVASRDGQRAR